jgi:hypothetical protein
MPFGLRSWITSIELITQIYVVAQIIKHLPFGRVLFGLYRLLIWALGGRLGMAKKSDFGRTIGWAILAWPYNFGPCM